VAIGADYRPPAFAARNAAHAARNVTRACRAQRHPRLLRAQRDFQGSGLFVRVQARDSSI
jgi:hypothetical protein